MKVSSRQLASNLLKTDRSPLVFEHPAKVGSHLQQATSTPSAIYVMNRSRFFEKNDEEESAAGEAELIYISARSCWKDASLC